MQTKQTIILNENDKKKMTLRELRLSIDKATDKEYLNIYWSMKKDLGFKLNNALCKEIILWIMEGKTKKWITDMVFYLMIQKNHVDIMNQNAILKAELAKSKMEGK